MIYGTGVDLVSIDRIERVYARFAERFVRRILNEQEFDAFHAAIRPVNFLSKRFAAKEAAVKALGTGERNGVLLRDFYLVHDILGKPQLMADGQAAKVCQSVNITRLHLSLTDENNQVLAFVVLESN